ncbi:MAG: LppX_LprAFG lipoprotein [Nocardioides sp.]
MSATVSRLTLSLAALLLSVVACSKPDAPPQDPDTVLAAAKNQLDSTSGVSLALATEQLPQGVDGLKAATGVGTHAPAFEGTVDLVINDLAVEVPVVAVDGLVFAKLPFTNSYSEIDPAEYGAPDPASLMDPSRGLSSWLTQATDVRRDGQVREGDAVLTAYTGTLPGRVVRRSIPGAAASADFEVTFNVADTGQLHSAVVSGPFYSDAGTVEYTVTFTKYGTQREISRP